MPSLSPTAASVRLPCGWFLASFGRSNPNCRYDRQASSRLQPTLIDMGLLSVGELAQAETERERVRRRTGVGLALGELEKT